MLPAVRGFAVCEAQLVSGARDGKGRSLLPASIDSEDHGDEIERHQGTAEAERRYVGETEEQVRNGSDDRYEHSKGPDLASCRKKKRKDDERKIDRVGQFTSEQEIKQFDPTIHDR